ncbi:MAG: cell division protein FtsL [Betaproteobacteria bacterium]|jgi:cell division protein FtsL
MIRLNLVLLLIAVACALGTVTAQHRARVLFVDLEKAQTAARELEEDWGRLQLEQSTWAMHPRIESVATSRLHMRVPPPSRVQMLAAPTAAPEPAP